MVSKHTSHVSLSSRRSSELEQASKSGDDTSKRRGKGTKKSYCCYGNQVRVTMKRGKKQSGKTVSNVRFENNMFMSD